ncbi:MAG TPA: DsbE family thiol:disulfide interchange protein [Chromatiales bacterium]|nr:DsbE family thiol:disulfide interchange protein [Chromatiales bacterium]
MSARAPLRYGLPLLAFAALAALLWQGLGRDPKLVPSPLVGKPAPAFALPSLRDPARIVGTEDMRGRAALLNVWASWCTACRQEHPLLMRIAREEGVVIYGLNYKDRREDALRWLDGLGDPYRWSAHDLKGRVGIDWGVYGVPETFVLDARGVIRYKHVGPIDEKVWRERLAPLLARLSAEAGEDAR